jgi:hypothetical protein
MRRTNYGLYPNPEIDANNWHQVKGLTSADSSFRGYTIHITEWQHNNPEEHYWPQTTVRVYKHGKLCAEFNRNYPTFVGILATQNNTDYLITSANYQCITICNLSTGEVKSYTDLDDVKHGFGFCPIEFDWDEEENTLVVEGCLWGFPTERMICEGIDLENPTNAFNRAQWVDEE